MRKSTLAAVAAFATLAAAPAFAQDMSAPPPAQDTATAPADNGTPRAPDGSKAFGIEPYFGVMGGWESFDNESNHGIPRALNSNGSVRNNYRLEGALVQGVAGVNVPLGPLFVGAEGNVAKGISGNIDWEYGAAGRVGFRAGDSGLFYGKAGYQWVNFDHFSTYNTGGSTSRDYGAATYGIGFEVGPKDIGLKGLTGNAGFRLRGEVNTYGNFHSLRPMLGVITHF